MRTALEDYSRLNETNLHAHYLIPSCGLWHLYATNNTKLIQPKASLLQLDCETVYDAEDRGPRKLIQNEEDTIESVLNNDEQKLPPPPSSSLKSSPAAVLMPRLRWTNLGHSYHWGTKSYDFSKEQPQALPDELGEICKHLVKGVDWEDVWAACSEEEMGILSEEEWRMWDISYGK